MTDPIFLQHTRRHGPTCKMGHVIAQLPKEQVKKLEEAFKDPAVSSTAISKVLTIWGHDVSYQITTRHRRGECSCARS